MTQRPQRLQKILAQHGVGSRRQIEQLISKRQITINGVIATLGSKVSANDIVQVCGKVIDLPDNVQSIKTRILLYHKPLGEICSRSDPQKRPTVFANLPPLAEGRWITIGRLDINTSGLLLFTNNGDVANALMHPRANLTRKYAVRIFGTVTVENLKQLRQGVILADGTAKFDTIKAVGGKGINRWYHVTIREGRNREVRRLWQSQELQVSRIIRIQFGPICLPDKLQIGAVHELKKQEIDKLIRNLSLI